MKDVTRFSRVEAKKKVKIIIMIILYNLFPLHPRKFKQLYGYCYTAQDLFLGLITCSLIQFQPYIPH